MFLCLFFRVDSVMLLEDGFEVVSSDASDKMLKTAYKLRWDRRRETAFDNWSRCTNLFCSSHILRYKMRSRKIPCTIFKMPSIHMYKGEWDRKLNKIGQSEKGVKIGKK